MNKFAKLVMFSSAIVGAQFASTAAMAQTAPTGTYSGNVTVEKGIQLGCVLTLDVDNPTSGKVGVSLTAGNPFCAALSFSGAPYNYTYTAGGGGAGIGTFTVHGVYVNTITAGDCSGDITATWNGSSFTVNTFLPTATTGTPDCTIVGTAS